MPAVAARAAEATDRVPKARALPRPARWQRVGQRQLELRAAADRHHLAVAETERERGRGRALEPHDRDRDGAVGAPHLAAERPTRRPLLTGQEELQLLAGPPASSKRHHIPSTRRAGPDPSGLRRTLPAVVESHGTSPHEGAVDADTH